MEKFEFQKRLEKKRAYLNCLMIFCALLIPTLLSAFKQMNLPWALQVFCYVMLLSAMLLCHVKAASIAAKVIAAHNLKK